MKVFTIIVVLLTVLTAGAQERQVQILKEMKHQAAWGLTDKWYPVVLDTEDGGYFTTITYDFKVGDNQDKMIVTQSRHLWVTSQAAMHYNESRYLNYAEHGFDFLKTKMWDANHGGFYDLVDKKGIPIETEKPKKTAYGNAFAIYGLAAYYKASGNKQALELAKKTFYWLEEHSHDKLYKGYYQSLELDGTPIKRDETFASTSEVGYKDQNSSIHLLEAFTELYPIWPDKLLKQRLEELLILIRDTIVNEDHYMNLFFTENWNPVSFKDTSRESIKTHYYLDHVSFGHDVETAYLMLEASDVLGREDHKITLKVAKQMVDHSLENGWDTVLGGLFDGGYYFSGEEKLEIVNSDKNWWSQAEALNSLLLMQAHFPSDKHNYQQRFEELWTYVDNYLLDHTHGGWYEWGLDQRPENLKGDKGHIWKATYHHYRALLNCIKRLESN
ncbi:N-acylglucosamine 2-epimerase [Galbibacter marinus]|uniref:N-acylglucosamine 2-epimerase n=1 Tax=Galbibacter marinus TaxID=555500 RepID=K2Q2F2_9FLAO|nr:AGE family epimerase/isomerase [Galbibacter marinus]EKF55046.1 N-acylglucosamine 2-epimerase [Galbibacter marinus]